MKIVPLAQAKNELSAYVDVAQEDRVLITRHGRPAALLIGVEGEELEDLLTRANPRFWEMIEARGRNSDTMSAVEMRDRLGLSRGAPSKRPSKAKRKPSTSLKKSRSA